MKQKIYQPVNLVKPAELKIYIKEIARIMSKKPLAKKANFLPIVKVFLNQRKKLLLFARKIKTPAYLLDTKALKKSLTDFSQTFRRYLPQAKFFYAVKVNHYPYILSQAVKHGFGLDVSSGRELNMAIKAKAKRVVFSGPGKTTEDLQLAIKNSSKVIVNMDNFSELKRLGNLATKHKKKIVCGIRIFTNQHGEWNKFGIPLAELNQFFQDAEKFSYLDLQGIQCHLSFNDSAEPYCEAIKEIALYLRKKFNSKYLSKLKFLDLGGGFMPDGTEGYWPWETEAGELINLAAAHLKKQPKFLDKYYYRSKVSLQHYAFNIAHTLKQEFNFLPKLNYYFEPGRIICDQAIHILLKVVDLKNKAVVVDGGINMVGWEKYETYYAPIINLTHPSTQEKQTKILGPLCLPDDMWGYTCFASKIEEGDLLIMPNQGALTYSFAQNFIKAIPPVYPAPFLIH